MTNMTKVKGADALPIGREDAVRKAGRGQQALLPGGQRLELRAPGEELDQQLGVQARAVRALVIVARVVKNPPLRTFWSMSQKERAMASDGCLPP